MNSNAVSPSNQAISHKQCKRCGAWKILDSFHKDRSNKTGRAAWCKECASQYAREYRKKNRMKLKAKRNSIDGCAKHVVSLSHYRAKEYGVKDTLIWQDWKEVWLASRGYCHYCETHCGLMGLTLDHKTPFSKGGPNSIDNVVPACLDCNRSKGNKTADQFYSRIAANRKLEQKV